MTPFKFRLKKNLLTQSGFNIKLFIIIFSVFLLISYGLFNARNLIIGPTIEIFSPSSETETKENTIIIKGRAKNITFLSLNERPIFVDKEGFFEERLLISAGFNIIQLKARDRFKQETLKTIEIYHKQATTTLDN